MHGLAELGPIRQPNANGAVRMRTYGSSVRLADGSQLWHLIHLIHSERFERLGARSARS